MPLISPLMPVPLKDLWVKNIPLPTLTRNDVYQQIYRRQTETHVRTASGRKYSETNFYCRMPFLTPTGRHQSLGLTLSSTIVT